MFDPIHYVATPVDTQSGHPRPSYERPVAVVNCEDYTDISTTEGKGRQIKPQDKIIVYLAIDYNCVDSRADTSRAAVDTGVSHCNEDITPDALTSETVSHSEHDNVATSQDHLNSDLTSRFFPQIKQ